MIFLLGLCALGAVVTGLVLISSHPKETVTTDLGRPVARPVSETVQRRRDRVSAGAAALALLCVVGAVLALFFVPAVRSESVTSTAGSSVVVETGETSPVIPLNGWVNVGAVAGAVLVLAVGLRLGRPPRPVLLAMGYVTAACCLISAASIGIFFLPVAILLLVSGYTSQHSASRPPHQRREISRA